MLGFANIPIRQRLLIPPVENSVARNAYRPLDVVRTRSGKTVEIGNTDAEGRLILCDGLTEADSERPDLLVDCATLAGAARIALGPDVQALFCDDDAVAEGLSKAGASVGDTSARRSGARLLCGCAPRGSRRTFSAQRHRGVAVNDPA